MKPGSAGGGKGTLLLVRSRRRRCQGDWPLACEHPQWPELSERAVPRGEDIRTRCACAARNGRDIVGLTVKPVGKPDAGNPHVRFDERGRETGTFSTSAEAVCCCSAS